MDLKADFFSLFGLAPEFSIDAAALDQRYREIQAKVHPDRFANADDAARRLSMQQATFANEAYLTLKKPLLRAQYLLLLAGEDVQAESNTTMPVDFLMVQMEWREAVMEARAGRDHHELERLFQRLEHELANHYADFADQIKKENLVMAKDIVRRSMFLEKLLHEIDDALASLDD